MEVHTLNLESIFAEWRTKETSAKSNKRAASTVLNSLNSYVVNNKRREFKETRGVIRSDFFLAYRTGRRTSVSVHERRRGFPTGLPVTFGQDVRLVCQLMPLKGGERQSVSNLNCIRPVACARPLLEPTNAGASEILSSDWERFVYPAPFLVYVSSFLSEAVIRSIGRRALRFRFICRETFNGKLGPGRLNAYEILIDRRRV